MGPRVLGQAASHANLIVMTNFASRLGEGSISALSYAQHLVMFPHGILAMSLSTVMFPELARQFELGKLTELKGTLVRALGPLVLLTLGATIGLFLFRRSIVQIVFAYGSFTPESTVLVTEAVGYFALGLLARSLIEPITRAFYAMHDTRSPLIVSLLTIVANIGLSWVLAPRLGHGGLALSISLTSIMRLMILLTVLSRRTGGFWRMLPGSWLRMIPAVVAFAAAAWVLELWLQQVTDPSNGRTIWAYIAFALALSGGAALYLGVAAALRIPDAFRILQMGRKLVWGGVSRLHR